MKIAVLFDQFGPYHIARLNALSVKTETIGIEIAGISYEYKWNKVTEGVNFKRITLFPDETSNNIKTSSLKKKLFSMLDEINPDVIAIPGYSSREALLALYWSIKNNVKRILMSESTLYDEERKFFKEFVKSEIIKFYDSAIVGGFRQKEYLEHLKFNAEIFFGYAVVDNKYFESQVKKLKPYASEIKKKYGINRDFFLVSCRFLPRKNFLNLINAYKLYIESTENIFDLVILGDGPDFERIKKLIRDYSLEDYIHLMGFIQYDGIVEFYTSARVFIHPSLREQWGLVVNEAMASGLPVIVSNKCGCTPNLVKECVNGYLFDPEKPEELCKLMLKASEDIRLLEQMGENSRSIISSLTPELFAENILKAAETNFNSSYNNKFIPELFLKSLIFFSYLKKI